MYLSLDAFNSRTASLKDVPRRVLARHKILVVFPIPGGPCKKKKNKIQKHYFPNIPLLREPIALQKSPFTFNALLEIKSRYSILKWTGLKYVRQRKGHLYGINNYLIQSSFSREIGLILTTERKECDSTYSNNDVRHIPLFCKNLTLTKEQKYQNVRMHQID